MENGYKIEKAKKGYYQRIEMPDGIYYEIYDKTGNWVTSCKEYHDEEDET